MNVRQRVSVPTRTMLLPLLSGFISVACAQTTQALISGHLVNSLTGRAVVSGLVTAVGPASESRAFSDNSGTYYLPLLSPGVYRVRATAPEFQAQEIQELELTVAGRLDVDFRLRPLSDIWESGRYRSVFLPGSRTVVTFFGPDVDPSRSGSFEAQKGRIGSLESTVSNVIDSDQLDSLPLLGRDVYSVLATSPGVSADSAARGLGLAVNGQRPSSSNYLLDGVENDNYLNTGPLVAVAPEAIQEYRVSTNNFSAEYGRTSGFVANAVTRMGTNQFHGTGYFYLENSILDANGFQDNLLGIEREPTRQSQPGFVAGGPLQKNRLFFSSSYEYFHGRNFSAPVTLTLPNASVLFSALEIPPTNRSVDLLTKYEPPPAFSGPAVNRSLTLAVGPPVTVDRQLGVQRLDYSSRDGKDRIMGRFLLSRLTRPDFIWTPYPGFVSALHQDTYAVAGSYIHVLNSRVTNEARLSISTDNLNWNRPHPEIPTLISEAGEVLPGSPAFYAYQNVNRSGEVLDNLIWLRGAHLITVGGGLLERSSDGSQTYGRDGAYIFTNLITFALDRPLYFSVALQRAALPTFAQPEYDRTYRYHQYFAFFQDTFRLSHRLTVNYGVRYEHLGAPVNTGTTKDLLVQLGAGTNLAQKLTGANLSLPSNGNQPLFSTDNGDFAVRAGATYDLTNKAKTLLRGGYGIFYDRPYDNLWQTLRLNSIALPLFNLQPRSAAQPPQMDVLTPVSKVIAGLSSTTFTTPIQDLTLVNPDLKNGRVYTYFAGLQHRFADNLTAEINALGSYGRRLITTDIVNRDFSTATGRYTGALPNLNYRDGAGSSDYNALTAVVRYRPSRGFLQASYTWSHTIDLQSEALVGDLALNTNFTSVLVGANSTSGSATFARQFDSNADRGNADFDQRHSFVLHGFWNPQPIFSASHARLLFRNWSFGTILSIRSGFPYSLIGSSGVLIGKGEILNNRPNLVNPAIEQEDQPVVGGVRLLNPAAFANAAPSTLGNVGRNAFTGPGFYNFDMSLGRTFPLPRLGESSRLNFRADIFNVLNHANLGNPDPVLPDPNFGVATFGNRSYHGLQFPDIQPLDETPRQIQLSVRLQF